MTTLRISERRARNLLRSTFQSEAQVSSPSSPTNQPFSKQEQIFLEGLLALIEDMRGEDKKPKPLAPAKQKSQKKPAATNPLPKQKVTEPPISNTSSQPKKHPASNKQEGQNCLPPNKAHPNQGLHQQPFTQPQVQLQNQTKNPRFYVEKKLQEMVTQRGDFPFQRPGDINRTCCLPIRIAYNSFWLQGKEAEDPTLPARKYLFHWQLAQSDQIFSHQTS